MSSYELQFGTEPSVVVTLSGTVEYETVRALFAELEELAQQNPELTVLVDETATKPGLVGPKDLRKMMDQWGRMPALRRSKLAVVAPSTVMYGINRMAMAVAGRGADAYLHVSRDRDAALAWLAAETHIA